MAQRFLVAASVVLSVYSTAYAAETEGDKPKQDGETPQTAGETPRTAGETPETAVPVPAPPEAASESPAPRTADEQRIEDARASFRRGTELARQARWLDALEAFERSASLRAHPITSYNIAYCLRALARYSRASKLFAEAIAAHEGGRSGRMTEPMLLAARTYRAEVEAKLARARVTLLPKGAAIAVNGRPLERIQDSGTTPVFRAGTRDPADPQPVGLESFEIVLDPGQQVFVISFAGDTKTTTHAMFSGKAISLKFVMENSSAREARPPTLPSTSPWVYAAYGVGGAALLTAAGFGIAAIVKRSELDDACGSPPRCPSSAQGDLDQAKTYAQITNIGLGVGIVGVAVGTYLLLTGQSGETESRTTARRQQSGLVVRPIGGLGFIGGSAQF
jgi:tetratricopeptide (TPR) repeat protein